MLLYIARHGQTDHNIQGIIQGQLDTPLNDWGRKESSRLADALAEIKFDEAYTSPLSRAHETASIVMAKHPETILESHDLLKERGLGSLEGKRHKKGTDFPADIETREAVAERIFQWLDQLLQTHTTARESLKTPTVESIDQPKILVVSHSAWISHFLRVVLAKPLAFELLRGVDLNAHMMNTCVMTVRIWQSSTGKWKGVITSFGDVRHLKGMKEPVIDSADLLE